MQDGQPYLGATLLLTASVLAAAPRLEQLRLHLPAGLAQRLDRWGFSASWLISDAQLSWAYANEPN